MRRRRQVLAVAALVLAAGQAAWAGPPVAEPHSGPLTTTRSRSTPERRLSPQPILDRRLSPRPTPQPPPVSQLPPPLGESERMEFDRRRTQGILLYRAGRLTEAAGWFRYALRIRPDDAITRAWLHACEDP